MTDDDESRIIDHDTFVKGHAFHFAHQPYLKLLFQAVRDKTRPLTLVVGAGVSMNASLPSWPELVSKMTAAIEDETLRAIAKSGPSDPMRKAEIILHLAKLKNLNAAEHEIIRDALYQKDLQVSPGQLALSLARLIFVRRKYGTRGLFDHQQAGVEALQPVDRGAGTGCYACPEQLRRRLRPSECVSSG